MKKVNTSLLILLLPLLLSAQNYTLIGDKAFGTSGGDKFPVIIRLKNHLIIAGDCNYTGINGDKTSMGCPSNPSNYDSWILMTDQNLNKIWDQTLGGTKRDEVHGIASGINNTLIITGETNSDSSCNISTHTRGYPDFIWYMLDSSGNKLMENRYGSNNIEVGGKTLRCRNKDYLIFGGSTGGVSGDKTTPGYGGSDLWLVRTDSLGNKLWDQTYGGSTNEPVNSTVYYTLLESASTDLLLCGYTGGSLNGTITVPGFGQGDAWITKTDNQGNQLWDKMFGGTNNEYIGSVLELQDSYMLLGSSNSKTGGTISDTGIANYDVWLIKIDTLGNQIWDKRYGGLDSDGGIEIQAAPDGGFWILASTQSTAGYSISESSYGSMDYWIFKIDTAGTILWDKRFGGPGIDQASNFIIMPDSSIYICGYADSGTSSVKTDPGRGDFDYWVVHFNYYNNTTGLGAINSANGISIAPNPAQDVVTISGLPPIGLEVSLYDLEGRLIHREFLSATKSFQYDLPEIYQGMYVMRFEGKDFSAALKLVKQ